MKNTKTFIEGLDNEANYAISKADFIAKIKEAAETEYWIILLEKPGYIEVNKCDIKNKCLSLKLVKEMND